jgi:hypothetical protein
MKLNKSDLARKLGCSERALSLWQKEGLPVLEHGRRGRPNSYDLAAVVTWLKRTGRGLMHSTRPDRGPIDIEALERELGTLEAPTTRQAAEDVYNHLCKQGAPRLAARFYARSGNIAIACDQALDVFDVFWNVLAERCNCSDDEFGATGDGDIAWLWDSKSPDRHQQIQLVYQLTPMEREAIAPELALMQTSAPENRNEQSDDDV